MDDQIRSYRKSGMEYREQDLQVMMDAFGTHNEYDTLPSQQSLQNFYSYLKREYFDNHNYFRGRKELPSVDDVYISWSNRLKKTVGMCSTSAERRQTVPDGYSNWIRLAIGYHQKYPFDVLDILGHEMIHLIVNGHPQEFQDILHGLQDLGLRTFRYSRDKGEPREQRKERREKERQKKKEKRQKANHALVCDTCDEVMWYIRKSKRVKEVKRTGRILHEEYQNYKPWSWRNCTGYLEYRKVDDGDIVN
jgi:hypothetical protein